MQTIMMLLYIPLNLREAQRNFRIFAILGHGSLQPSVFTGKYGDQGPLGIKSL